MFFEIDKYTPEELKTFWQTFSKLTNHYTSNERWGEIVPKNDEFSDFLSLTFDNILFDGHEKLFKTEDDMKTHSPFVFTSVSIVLAKKVIFDYGVAQNIPYYEFETYYQTTRLTSIFERAQEFSELEEDYKRCQEILLTTFPEEETTLWRLFTMPELSEKLDKLFDDKDFGFSLIELFTNILTFDFVRNYLKLSNERRNLNSLPEINVSNTCCETEGEECLDVVEDACIGVAQEPYYDCGDCDCSDY